MNQFNYTQYITKAAVAFQEQLDCIDTDDTPTDCSKHAGRAAGIVLALHCLSDTLGGDSAEELDGLCDSWKDDIEAHFDNRLDALRGETDFERTYVNE